MINFKISSRYINKNGFWPVFIRVTNYKKVGYIKTPWVVDKRGITKDGEITDPYVLEKCSKQVNEYIRRLNGLDCSTWSFDRLSFEVSLFFISKKNSAQISL